MFRLKEFRVANNLKQSDLQEILGCKQSFISRVENAREALPGNFIQKLIDAYGKDKVMPYNETDVDEQVVESKHTVPYEFVESLIEERKRHDEMTAELIRQNGELIELLKDSPRANVRGDDNASCAIASGSDLVE